MTSGWRFGTFSTGSGIEAGSERKTEYGHMPVGGSEKAFTTKVHQGPGIGKSPQVSER